jgi:hypothetical protein
MAAVLFALLAVLLGYLIVLRFSDLPLFSWLGTGTLLGIGTTSCLFFLCRLFVPAIPRLSLMIETVLAIALIADLARLKRRPSVNIKLSAAEWALSFGLILAIGIATQVMFSTYSANPLGEWDAWSIWNVRAKMLASDAALTPRAWSSLLAHTHPEYPLLLSAFIARCWAYGGATTAAAPIVTSYLFWLALLMVAGSGLARVRGATLGIAFALLLATTPLLLEQVPAQYADVPLAAYCTGSLLLLLENQPVWAGCLAGFAGFTKDEGIVFFVAMSLAVMVFDRSKSRKFAAGLAAPALILFAFKGLLAPSNVSALSRGMPSVFSHLADLSRYGQIASAVIGQFKDMSIGYYHPIYPAIALALIYGVDRARWLQVRIPILVSVMMIAGYWGAYLVTADDLAWRLSTSLDRLFVQIWPLLILTVLLSLGAPEPEKTE